MMDMDSKIKTILDAKLKQIDIELEQELIRIGEEYSRRGIPGSGLHLRAQGLAKIKASAKKEEIKAELEQKLEQSETDIKQSLHLANTSYDKQDAKINFDVRNITIPRGRKYLVTRKMAKLFENKQKVDNYLLAACITPTLRAQNRYRKFKKADYDKKKHGNQIKNRFRTLRKFLKPLDCTVEFSGQFSNLVRLQG